VNAGKKYINLREKKEKPLYEKKYFLLQQKK
jgi:hypothetical protein